MAKIKKRKIVKSKKRSVRAKKFDFLDFLNAKYGTRDSDQDGLSDEVERLIGTDPYKADTDNDGMSDAEEIRRGRNPLGPGDFRDWFLPHEGNNYHPHALHPKRLLFYAGSAALIKMMVVAFALSFPLTAWLAPEALRSQALKIIALTNEVRQAAGAVALVENTQLSAAAFAKASDMLLQQYFAHTGPDKKTLADWLKSVGYRYRVAGENLAMGFNQPEEVVAAWQKSQTHYANLVDPDFSQVGVGATAGPYQEQETTFVAQYFGRPVSAAVVKPATVSAPAATRDLGQAERLPVSEGAAVAAVRGQTLTPLAKPILLSFTDKLLTNQAQLSLAIFSPKAEQVTIYNNEQKIVTDSGARDERHLTVTLTPGKNVLRLEALRGDQRALSDNYLVELDQTPPQLDESKTSLWLDSPAGKEEAVIRVVAYLSEDTTSAQLGVSDWRFKLTPDEAVSGRWFGQTVIPDRSRLQPLVSADLTVEDRAGNSHTYNLSWANATLAKSSLAKQYFFLRATAASAVQPLFNFSSLFYKILLTLAIIALGLAVLIEIKKQRPKLIVSTLGFIGFLIILLIV